MNTFKTCMLSISIGMVLALSGTDNFDEENLTWSEQYANANQSLLSWSLEKDADLECLRKICISILLMSERDGLENKLPEKISLLISLLNTTDQYYNPDYETPFLNMVPPGGNYRSGVAPESVKEPEIREAYEKAIAENKKKIEISRFQSKFERIRHRCFDYLTKYFTQNYTGEKQLDEFLTNKLTKESTKQELIEMFKKAKTKNN